MLKLEIARKISEDAKRFIKDAENAWVETQIKYAHDYIDGKILEAIRLGRQNIFIEPYDLCKTLPRVKTKWWKKKKLLPDWSNYTFALKRRVTDDYRKEGYTVSDDYTSSFSLSWRVK